MLFSWYMGIPLRDPEVKVCKGQAHLWELPAGYSHAQMAEESSEWWLALWNPATWHPMALPASACQFGESNNVYWPAGQSVPESSERMLPQGFL